MEDKRDFEERYDACMLDFTVKCVGGAALGSLIGGFFLKTRKWPSIFGGGLGFGMAYLNCENSLNQFLWDQEEPNPCRTLKKSMEKRLSNVKK